jgi:uncharacterized protein YggU (UPF0235/DUF167 family)
VGAALGRFRVITKLFGRYAAQVSVITRNWQAETVEDRVRVTLRVRPGASRTAVGGAYGDSLVVRVAARAVDGAATEAALEAVAKALGVRRRHVALVSGATSRAKVVAVTGDAREIHRRVRKLRDSS